MPSIDLGSVVGPQGAQGNTGPQGPQGVAGPSLISASTETTLNGVLAGIGNTVGVRLVDDAPTNLSNNLISSGAVFSALSLKADASDLEKEIIKVNMGTLTGTGGTVTVTKNTGNAAKITADHVVLAYELGNPAAQVGELTWTTSAGAVSVSGNINGSTTLVIYLGKVGTTVS